MMYFIECRQSRPAHNCLGNAGESRFQGLVTLCLSCSSEVPGEAHHIELREDPPIYRRLRPARRRSGIPRPDACDQGSCSCTRRSQPIPNCVVVDDGDDVRGRLLAHSFRGTVYRAGALADMLRRGVRCSDGRPPSPAVWRTHTTRRVSGTAIERVVRVVLCVQPSGHCKGGIGDCQDSVATSGRGTSPLTGTVAASWPHPDAPGRLPPAKGAGPRGSMLPTTPPCHFWVK